MPVITLDVSATTPEQKEKLIREFTKKASEIIGLPEDKFIVFIREHGYDNIGVGGTQLSVSLQKK